jgi:arabinofuranosyltransferase
VRVPLQSRAAGLAFLGLISFAVVVGAIMIARSSIVAVDGHRYFALFDDGMITMRYADNLVSGRGLVWNSGERVEGFSSPLWVFILAGFVAVFGRNAGVAAVQVFGLLLVICDLVLVLFIAGRLLDGHKRQDVGALGAVLITMTFYPLFYWSIMGMETGLLVPVLLLVVLLSLRGSANPRDRFVIAFLLSLGWLLRPETMLFIAVHYAFEVIRRVRARIRPGWALVAEAALLVIPVAAYQTFRVAYYHQWIANSHRLKLQGLGMAEQLADGWAFLEPFLIWGGWLALALAAYLGVSAWRASGATAGADAGRPRTEGFLAEFLVLFVVYALYQIAIGGDAWPFFVRFPVPATVLLFIGFVVAVLLAFERMPRSRLWSGGALALTLFWLLRWTAEIYRTDLFTLTPFYSKASAADVNTALTIKRLTDASATVASFGAGLIPYYSERRGIDPLGKCDPVIARLPIGPKVPGFPEGSLPGHNKYDLDYSLKAKRPTAIQWVQASPCTWGAQNLSQWCHANYDEVAVAGGHFLLDKQSPLVRRELLTPTTR